LSRVCEPSAVGKFIRRAEDRKVVFIGAGIGIGEACEVLG
jgi:ferredoxin-NADP reductase